jgi:hypothetical protein
MRALLFWLASIVLLAAPARAETLHEALEAYALYQNDVSVLSDLDIDSAAAVNGALERLSRHDPARLARGFMAYGALTAAQSPAFVAGVERRVRREGREPVLAQLRRDPAWARAQARGAGQAIDLVLAAATADSARAARAGDRYEHIARTSQARWIGSKDRTAAQLTSARLTPEMRSRLSVGALDARPQRDREAFGGARFWDSLAGRAGEDGASGGGREQRTHADVTNRMLTAGALVVAGERSGARMSALLDEPLTRHCLVMQRLQLRQCLGASVDASERTYCLARHGLTGPGTCFSAMAR